MSANPEQEAPRPPHHCTVTEQEVSVQTRRSGATHLLSLYTVTCDSCDLHMERRAPGSAGAIARRHEHAHQS